MLHLRRSPGVAPGAPVQVGGDLILTAETGTFTLTGQAATLTPGVPLAGALAYEGFTETVVGAPNGTVIEFGKHNMVAYCPVDGKIYVFGGDGQYRTASGNFTPDNIGNQAFQYDFGNGGAFVEFTEKYGNPADGTCPYVQDGTWVYNSNDDHFYALPGWLEPVYRPAMDPHGIMQAHYGWAHKLNRVTGAWSVASSGVVIGNWINYASDSEHWGGCFRPSDNTIWIQTAATNPPYGALKSFNCANGQIIGPYTMALCPGIENVFPVAQDVRTHKWPQEYNPNTNELICFDAYRGHILGVRLDHGGTFQYPCRIIGNGQPPALFDSGGAESVQAIEASMTISVARQKAYISYPNQRFVVGGLTGVWVVDLNGVEATYRVGYPASPATDSSWTVSVYDDTNDLLILFSNINDNVVWGRRFLRYRHTA